MRPKPRSKDPQVVGFLGVGLDNDGHRRITECDNFLLVGGSEETHERIQETAVRFGEALERRGERLQDLPPERVVELLHEARRKQ